MADSTPTAFERMWRTRTDRRAFLLGGLALVGAGAFTRVQARPRWADTPFVLGVASGDPTHDGVVIWTRLARDPLNGGGMSPEAVEVRWEVADDQAMRNIVKQGRATAAAAGAHSVHVEVEDLRPNRFYRQKRTTAPHLQPLAAAIVALPCGWFGELKVEGDG